jgi:hypothetical protein
MTLGAGLQDDPALLAKEEFLNVFDGSTLWSYLPRLNEYSTFTTRFPEGMSPEGVDRLFGIGSFHDLVGASPGRRVRVLRALLRQPTTTPFATSSSSLILSARVLSGSTRNATTFFGKMRTSAAMERP